MNQAKNFVRDVFDDMVERRLWPVAVILLVALVAVPVLLAKSSSNATAPLPGPTTPAVSGAPSPLAAFEPAVTAAEPSAERKSSGGHEKNPFTAKGIKAPPPGAAAAAGNAQPNTGAGSGGGTVTTNTPTQGASGGGSTKTTGSKGTKGGSTTPATKFYTYTAKLKFGEEGKAQRYTVSPLRALPSTDNPVAIFMGVKKDGKTAVFVLSSSTTTTGDGKCAPSDSTCTFLDMKKGDTQIIEAVTADGNIVTYDLELVSIAAKATQGPSASSSRKKKGAHASSSSARKAARKAARVRARHAQKAFSTLPF